MTTKKAPARPGRLRRAARAAGPRSLDWTSDASCAGRDTELFFPEGDQPTIIAKHVCHRCPVRTDCLEHALVTDERYGIWGGLTEHERHLFRVRITASTVQAISTASGRHGGDDGPVAA